MPYYLPKTISGVHREFIFGPFHIQLTGLRSDSVFLLLANGRKSNLLPPAIARFLDYFYLCEPVVISVCMAPRWRLFDNGGFHVVVWKCNRICSLKIFFVRAKKALTITFVLLYFTLNMNCASTCTLSTLRSNSFRSLKICRQPCSMN